MARTLPLLFACALVAVAPLAQAQFAPAHALTPDGARHVAEVARAEAAAHGWTVAIAVVDAAGDLLYFERLPGTQPASTEIAIGKARTAARFKRSTATFEESVAGGRAALLALDLVPFEGGLPIRWEGEVVGAIGVSGVTPQQDGQIARAGVRAVVPDAD